MPKQIQLFTHGLVTVLFVFLLSACIGEAEDNTAKPEGFDTTRNSEPTANVVEITGNTFVGNTLTGGYAYSDVDGDPEGASSYRWLRDDQPISSATFLNYTLNQADAGTTISFEVTPKAATGAVIGQARSASIVVQFNDAPTANNVAIAGIPFVGNTLTGSYAFSDADGDLEGASSYRWLRGNQAISGATAASYTLIQADAGTTISFEVTPKAATGVAIGQAGSASIVVQFNDAPTASNVAIAGIPFVGNILTGSYAYSDVDGDPEGASSYRWLRDDQPISSATFLTYNLNQADAGTTISFEVTPNAATGVMIGQTRSASIVVQNSAPTASLVAITGSTLIGNTLTGTYAYSDVDGDPEGASSYRWLRDDQPISSATFLNYTLNQADAGTTISFEVTPKAATGVVIGQARSASIVVQFNDAPTASNVAITGMPFVGNILTGGYTYSDADSDLEGASTYLWLRDDQPIGSATSLNFTLNQADAGTTISFEVTPKAATGVVTGLAETASILIQNSAPTASDLLISMVNAFVDTTWFAQYTYADVDGDLTGTTRYQWLRNGVDITGATSASYTLTVADSGTQISVAITPIAATGTIEGITKLTAEHLVENSAPTASDLSISGGIFVGKTITAQYTYNDLDGDIEDSSVITWYRDDVYISESTDPTYVIIEADINRLIHFSVVPSAATGVFEGTKVSSIAFRAGPVAFIATNQSLGSANSDGVALGDLDGDGDLDMAVANGGSGGNKVYLNDGTANFSNPIQSLGENDSAAVALGDLDGNGDLDIVVANTSFDDIKLYRNDGSANFIIAQTYNTYSCISIALGDLDGDGDLDMVFSCRESTSYDDIYMNDGSGGFTGTKLFTSGKAVKSVALGDIDGDGDLDLVAGTGDHFSFNSVLDETRVYKNNGNGTFLTPALSIGLNQNSQIALGDLDNDGDLDIAVANPSLPDNKIYLNDGNGIFTELAQTLTNFNSSIVVLADIDQDNDLDFITGNKIYINDGLGNFSDFDITFRITSASAIALGDLDGDGDLDIVAVINGGNTVYINQR